MNSNLPKFLQQLAPWERRFSRKYRVELVHRMNEVLEEKNLSQKEVAERAGWKEPYLSRVLGGEQNLTLKTVARFEEAVEEDVLVIPLPKRPALRTNPRTNRVVYESTSADKSKLDMRSIFKNVELDLNSASKQGRYSIYRQPTLPHTDEEMADVG